MHTDRSSNTPILKAACLLSLLLWACVAAFPQAPSALNLKVKPRSNAEAYLRLNAGAARQRQAMPGMASLADFEAIQPLRAQAPAALAQLYTVQLPEGTDVAARAAALLATGQYEWVEPVRTVGTDAFLPASSDPKVGEQWYHDYVETFAAWDVTRGDATVVVGVLDTGLDFGHPEFEGQVAVKADEDRNGNGTYEPWPDSVLVNGVAGDFDGIDQDGNGYADDVVGWDFTDQPRSPFGGDYLFEDAHPQDDNNHGTLVAGIIAARADNGVGGTGIAPGCRLKVLRAFAGNGSGEDDDIARAIVYAADEGIHILNCSFGDIYPSQMMREAVRYAAGKGVVIVASAGNGTGDNPHYPSNFDEVISVSASALGVGDNEILWPLSSYGHGVSLCAPGSAVYAPMVRDTANEEDFDFFSGTSTSAPMVSAAVALLFSQRGACSPQQVRGILTSSADDIAEEGWDHFTGAGRLNIRKALQTVGASEVQVVSPTNDQGTLADDLPIVVTVLDPQFSSYGIYYQEGVEGLGEWVPLVEGITQQAHRDTAATWHIAPLDDGDYTIRLKVEKTNGTTAEDRVRLDIDRTPTFVDSMRVVHAWDNEQRKFMAVYRVSDRARVTLRYSSPLGAPYRSLSHDRLTRHGSFLLGVDELEAGPFSYYLHMENAAGTVNVTDADTFLYDPQFITMEGYDTLTYSLPMGHYLNKTFDMDGDGLKEVAMSEFDDRLGFGKLKYYEYNAVQFTAADSVDFKPILIPKDVADTDGDGLLELLCSVNDSLYVVEQASPVDYAKEIQYSNLNRDRFAARFGDVDGDTALELLAKDFEHYFVYQPNGSGGFTEGQALSDITPDYTGSVAPRALVEDFDGDGQNEVAFGDFDGDFVVYEWNGSALAPTFADTTTLTKSGSYITAGDFDGDGRAELFVAVHTSLNRNEEDFEYEPLYWWLRIFKATADDQFAMVWEDFLFDMDTEEFNAATAGNLDTDPADELVFTTFPRTYVIDFAGGNYGMQWFHYGDLATQHVIADFNGNGVGEVAIGRGDKAVFWERDFDYAGPQAVAYLDGRVMGADRNLLRWAASPNATGYRIWRGPITGGGSILISVIDSTAALSYLDTAGLVAGTRYLYVLESKNAGLLPAYSPFSYPIALMPHALGRLDSVVAVSATRAVAHFSLPVAPAPEAAQYCLLGDSLAALTLVGSGDLHRSVLLAFPDSFSVGANTLHITQGFLDAERAPLDSAFATATFQFIPQNLERAFFTRWEIVSPSRAQIWFDQPMTASVLDTALYAVAPMGRVTAVAFAGGTQDAILVDIEGAALGALGYPVSITLEGGASQDGDPMMEDAGNIATFSEFKPDLTGAFVYPNPYRRHSEFDGVRFANLTQFATVHILSADGRAVISLEEADGDGGLEWNLMDRWSKRVAPGVYLFRVESEGVEQMVGKFEILE